MFFIWGSGGGTEVAGDAGARHCPVCNTTRRFDLVVNYRYRHFWYLISWVSKRAYSLVCSHCHNALAQEPAKQEVAEKLSGQKDPIPFMRRRGWMVGVALFALLLGLGAYLSSEDEKEVLQSIAAPHVGDVYLADLSKISDGYKGERRAYGAMKLVAVDKSSEHFIFARSAYDRKKGVRKDVSKGLVKKDSYYDTDDIAELTPEQLTQWARQGVIYEVIH